VPDTLGWIVLVAGALVGSVIGGVAGFGAGVILLPLVAWTLGVRAIVPVLTVAMFLGNLSRVWWSRHDLDLRVVGRYLLGAVPATALGAVLYTGLTGASLGRIVGLFMLAAVLARRAFAAGRFRMRLRHFPLLGAAIGVLSSLVVTTGPIASLFFLAYGLRRGAFIGTEAACVLAMHLTRATVLSRYALLTWEAIVVGAVLGSAMFAGTWAARRILDRLSDHAFVLVVEALLVLLGLQFLVRPG
jgi:hypothetical protein